MATIRKTKFGSYRAQVCVSGTRASACFPTKPEAKDWAREQEAILRQNAKSKLIKLHSLDGGAVIAFFIPCRSDDVARLAEACAARLSTLLDVTLQSITR